MVDPGDHRIGDAERQQAIDMLRSHAGAGRLTLEEFEDLAAQVFAARTYGELEEVGRNVPPGVVLDPQRPPPAGGLQSGPRAAAPGWEAPVGPSGGPQPGRPLRRRFVAILSGAHARGLWRAPRHITAFTFWGGVVIDLRDAQVDAPVVDIFAWAIMGGVTVIVPEGVPIEADGMVVMGGVSQPRWSEPRPGAPLVRVHARGLWGGVNAVVKGPGRRTRREEDRDRHERERRRREARDERRDQRRRDRDHQRDRRRHRDDGADRPSDGRAAADVPDEDVPGGRPGSTGGAPDGRLELPPGVLDDLADVLERITRPPRPPEPARVPSPGPGREPSVGAEPQVPVPPPPPAPPAPPEPPAATRQPRSAGGTGAEGTSADGDAASAATAAPGNLPSGTLTMMVTDIADSTAFAERLGDQRWIEVLRHHNRLVREHVARHGGTEVKAQGDGFLVVFPGARRAILAAVDVQRALARHRTDHPDIPIELRIGLHTGDIVDVDGDVLGQNVVVAARIADHAGPGEIVVSGLTRDLTVSGGDLSFGPADEVALKGLSSPWRVHRVAWSHAPT